MTVQVCYYIENIELSLGDLLVAWPTSYRTSLMSLCRAAFMATASSSSSSSTLVAVTQAWQLRVATKPQKMRNIELIKIPSGFQENSSSLISASELDCVCIYYLSIDERTWGGCSWDTDSSDVWEADWNTHRSHQIRYYHYHQGKKYNGKVN